MAAALAVMALPWLRRALTSMPCLTPAEIHRRLAAGEQMLLLDVRSAAEFTGQGHIAGAVNIALPELAGRLDMVHRHMAERPPGVPLVLVCLSGGRALQAAAVLKQAGLGNAVILAGGMTGWTAAGLPVVLGTVAQGTGMGG